MSFTYVLWTLLMCCGTYSCVRDAIYVFLNFAMEKICNVLFLSDITGTIGTSYNTHSCLCVITLEKLV